MKSITLDRSRFEQQTSNLRRQLDNGIASKQRETDEKIRQTAIFVSRELAERTFPSSGAIGLAVAAMRFDVSKVYITAGRAFEILKGEAGNAIAGRFYAMFKKGDLSGARQVIRESGTSIQNIEIGRLDPAFHARARNQETGRVMLKQPAQIVEKSELEAYLKTQIAKIGKTASGWNACAMKLGGSESPTRWKSTAWHGADGGSVSERRENGTLVIELSNDRPLARKHISPGQVAAIMRRGMEFLETLLAR